jgi:hypothetical protein
MNQSKLHGKPHDPITAPKLYLIGDQAFNTGDFWEGLHIHTTTTRF